MRTKTTLAAAAILAAGLASSMAQGNVYSLNIVGYVNSTLTGAGSTAFSNPLRVDTGLPTQDRLDKVIPLVPFVNSTTPNNEGDSVQFYDGVKWNVWTLDSGSPSNWLNPLGAPAPAATLPVFGPGIGAFYTIGSFPASTAITLVGEVRLGVNVVSLTSGFNAIGSPLPYASLVKTGVIALPIADPADGSTVQKWNGVSWNVYTYDPVGNPALDWIGPSGQGPEPFINIAEGFFYENQSGATQIWTQTF